MKKKCLLINQHTSNHGDEAAAKGILRLLKNENYDISILYNTLHKLSKDEKILVDGINHYDTGGIKFIDKVLIYLTFLLPFYLVKKLYFLSDKLSNEYKIINENEYIINGPGGVNIGPYKDWKYIWRLFVSLKLNKKVAIYSISFGPLPTERIFKKISFFILNNCHFLSLRDNKSQQFAREMNINYQPSIDTAFLDKFENNNLPDDLKFLSRMSYVVIVPNQLYKWHPNFMKFDAEIVDNFYLQIINKFLENDIKIILLPQLFGGDNDYDYFMKLKNKSFNENNVYVINENYDSDIQQLIIRKSKFLIGSRYHSIIFSVKNKIPFYSLSYEHKMKNTLEILDLSQYSSDLLEILKNKDKDIINKIYSIYSQSSSISIEDACNKAKYIANDTFKCFKNKYFKDSI